MVFTISFLAVLWNNKGMKSKHSFHPFLRVIALCGFLFSCGNPATDSSVSSEAAKSSSVTSSTSVASSSKQSSEPLSGIKLRTTYKGGTISAQNSVLRSYLALTDADSEAQYLANNSSSNYGNAYDFAWNRTGRKTIVHFSTDPEFTNERLITTYDAELEESPELDFLVPGNTYYWKVTTDNGRTSEVDSFHIEDGAFRVLMLKGGDNIRDLGGFTTSSGKKVAFNKLFRGAKINNISKASQKIMTDVIGAKSELDLRSSSDDGGQEAGAFSDSYLQISMNQYANIIPGYMRAATGDFPSNQYTTGSVENVKKIFDYLADENNYPVYFHCNAGADRTGTLSFLIESFLGVSEEDMVRDFELTSFSSYGKRWRSGIQDGKFTSSGIMQHNSSNYVGYGEMVNTMKLKFGTTDGTIQDAVTNYLKSGCGISEDTLNKIQSILLPDNA